MDPRKLNVHIDPTMQKIMECLAEDEPGLFMQFLRKPEMGKRAIERVLKLRLATFSNIRILTLWHLFRKQNCDEVSLPPSEREVVLSYLYEPVQKDLVGETQSHIINALDDPSWLWLDALKRFWSPEMAEALQEKIRVVGSKRVSELITPLIVEYHTANKPYKSFDPEDAKKPPTVTIPSAWYRTLLYPLLGGEPRAIFNDQAMSYQETLSSMFASYAK